MGKMLTASNTHTCLAEDRTDIKKTNRQHVCLAENKTDTQTYRAQQFFFFMFSNLQCRNKKNIQSASLNYDMRKQGIHG